MLSTEVFTIVVLDNVTQQYASICKNSGSRFNVNI